MTARRPVRTPEGGITVKFSPAGGHLYYLGGDGPFPGATSITALQEAIGGTDGLLGWAVRETLNEARRYLDAGHDTVPALAAAATAKDKPSKLGSAIHKAVYAVNQGSPFAVSPEAAQFVAQYGAFLVRHRVEVIAAEGLVVNTTLRYGGAFDLLARMGDGRRFLLDVKSGKSRPSHRLQLTGYEMAEWTGPEGEQVAPMPEVDGCAVLLLRPDSFEVVEYQITDEDRAHFARLVETYHQAAAWAARDKESAA